MTSDRPLIMFHGNSRCYGKPNSSESVRRALAYHPDIIELDVRKNHDGILFCYHGGLFALFTNPNNKGCETLEKIVSHIPDTIIIFLDIKDTRITAADLRLITSRHPHIFWIASRNLNYLSTLHQQLPNLTYIYNAAPLLFTRGITQLADKNIAACKIFWWQWSEHNYNFAKKHNIGLALHSWFIPRTLYFKRAYTIKSLWVCLDVFK